MVECWRASTKARPNILATMFAMPTQSPFNQPALIPVTYSPGGAHFLDLAATRLD